ncbi:MAG: glycosyltransferase [Desulfovibrio sp.]|jgi:hypothetical protein|nr:glycosyltransferase [Desulfovibrio sp.]
MADGDPRASAPPASAPLVSVCLPCFNAAATLPAALESLLAQSLPHFEIIAADDGSTDDTPAILAAFAARDARSHRESRIRHLRLPHQGVALAWNAAVSAARAPFIARMDADDLCLPRRLELQVRRLEAEPGLDLVSGLVRFGGDRAKRLGYALHVDWLNTLVTHEAISLNRFVESPLANPSVMFRRAAWERFGPARPNTGNGCAPGGTLGDTLGDTLGGPPGSGSACAGPFPEDYEQWLRWLGQGARMAKVEEEILVWNDPPARLSRSAGEYSAEAFARAKAGHLRQWLAAHNPGHPRVWCWGAGRESRRRMAPLVALGVEIERYVDIDPRKVGQRVAGIPVLGREDVPPAQNGRNGKDRQAGQAAPFILVNVGSRGAREEILEWLAARGYQVGVDCLAVG